MNKDAIIKLVNEQMWAKTDADVPSFKAGDTITVSYKIIEGNKERVSSPSIRPTSTRSRSTRSVSYVVHASTTCAT